LNDVDKELNIYPPSHLKQDESADSIVDSREEEKELLLCFRPIREGDMAAEELRFCPKKEMYGSSSDGPTNASSEEPKVSASTNQGSSSGADGDSAEMAKKSAASTYPPSLMKTQLATAPLSSTPVKKNRPPKKRKVESQEEVPSNKKVCGGMRYGTDDAQADKPDEKSVVESMMELAKNQL
jgi:hypothetical protein